MIWQVSWNCSLLWIFIIRIKRREKFLPSNSMSSTPNRIMVTLMLWQKNSKETKHINPYWDKLMHVNLLSFYHVVYQKGYLLLVAISVSARSTWKCWFIWEKIKTTSFLNLWTHSKLSESPKQFIWWHNILKVHFQLFLP